MKYLFPEVLHTCIFALHEATRGGGRYFGTLVTTTSIKNRSYESTMTVVSARSVSGEKRTKNAHHVVSVSEFVDAIHGAQVPIA